jgi:tetratricopeptide (TPR) repeat protein
MGKTSDSEGSLVEHTLEDAESKFRVLSSAGIAPENELGESKASTELEVGKSLLQQAHFLEGEGLWADAAAVWTRLASPVADDEASRAYCLLLAGEPDEAEVVARAALRVEDTAWTRCVAAYTRMRTFPNMPSLLGMPAIDQEYIRHHLEHAIQRPFCPPYAFLLLEGSLIGTSDEEIKKRLQYLRSGLEQHPEDESIRVRYARVLHTMCQAPEEATDALQPLLRGANASASVLWEALLAFRRLDLYEEALLCLERMDRRQEREQHRWGWELMKASLLIGAGRIEEALELYAEVVRQGRDESQAVLRLNRAYGLLRADRIADALEDVRAATALLFTSSNEFDHLEWEWLDSGNISEAAGEQEATLACSFFLQPQHRGLVGDRLYGRLCWVVDAANLGYTNPPWPDPSVTGRDGVRDDAIRYAPEPCCASRLAHYFAFDTPDAGRAAPWLVTMCEFRLRPEWPFGSPSRETITHWMQFMLGEAPDMSLQQRRSTHRELIALLERERSPTVLKNVFVPLYEVFWGAMLLEHRLLDAAAEVLDLLIDAVPDEPELRMHQAAVYLARGDRLRAQEIYQSAEASLVGPGNVDAATRMSWALKQTTEAPGTAIVVDTRSLPPLARNPDAQECLRTATDRWMGFDESERQILHLVWVLGPLPSGDSIREILWSDHEPDALWGTLHDAGAVIRNLSGRLEINPLLVPHLREITRKGAADHMEVAQYHQKEGNWAEAAEAWLALGQVSRSLASAAYCLLKLACSMRKHEEEDAARMLATARFVADRAVEIFSGAWEMSVAAYVRLGGTPERIVNEPGLDAALPFLKRATEQHGCPEYVFCMLADALPQKDVSGKDSVLKRGLAQHPRSFTLRKMVVHHTRVWLNDPDAALRLVEPLLDRADLPRALLCEAAVCLREVGQYERAVPLIKKLAEEDQSEARFPGPFDWFFAGTIADADHPEWERLMQKVINAARPRDRPLGLFLRAHKWVRTGRHAKALDDVAAAVDILYGEGGDLEPEVAYLQSTDVGPEPMTDHLWYGSEEVGFVCGSLLTGTGVPHVDSLLAARLAFIAADSTRIGGAARALAIPEAEARRLLMRRVDVAAADPRLLVGLFYRCLDGDRDVVGAARYLVRAIDDKSRQCTKETEDDLRGGVEWLVLALCRATQNVDLDTLRNVNHALAEETADRVDAAIVGAGWFDFLQTRWAERVSAAGLGNEEGALDRALAEVVRVGRTPVGTKRKPRKARSPNESRSRESKGKAVVLRDPAPGVSSVEDGELLTRWAQLDPWKRRMLATIHTAGGFTSWDELGRMCGQEDRYVRTSVRL